MKVKIAIILILVIGIACSITGFAANRDNFAAGLELFNSGKWTEAVGKLLSATSEKPNDATVRITTGVALANIKRYHDAVKQFKAAERITPNGVLPKLLLDGTYSELGDTANSRLARSQVSTMLASGKAFGAPGSSDNLLSASLMKYPDNAIARSLLGDLYQLQGKITLAQAQYAQASELASNWPKPVFNMGLSQLKTDPKLAEETFKKAIKMDRINKRIYLWLGDAYLAQGRYTEANNAYSTALKEKSLGAEAQTRLGNMELKSGNYKAASDQFSQANQQAPHDPRPIAGQAQALQNSGKLKDAESKYNEAASVLVGNCAPADSQVVMQNQIATVQAEQGKYNEALQSLKSSFRLKPTRENATLLVSAQKRANRLPEGVSEGEASLRRNPKSITAMVYLLSAYEANGNVLGRIDIASRLIKSDSAHAYIYYAELGNAHLGTGNSPEAISAYSHAFESASPNNWDEITVSAKRSGALDLITAYYDKMFSVGSKKQDGLILYALQSNSNNTAGMLKTADKLVKLNPEDPKLWLQLGEIYEKIGNKDMAVMAYSKAVTGTDTETTALARAKMEAIRAARASLNK